jgi:hypothetical protein
MVKVTLNVSFVNHIRRRVSLEPGGDKHRGGPAVAELQGVTGSGGADVMNDRERRRLVGRIIVVTATPATSHTPPC